MSFTLHHFIHKQRLHHHRSSHFSFISHISSVSSLASHQKMRPLREIIEAIELSEYGTSPHWDDETQSLFVIDRLGKVVHRYSPLTKLYMKGNIGHEAAFIVPAEGKKHHFITAVGRQFCKMIWDVESDKAPYVQTLCGVENTPDKADNQFNDGKCEPTGRLWAGTMGGFPEDLPIIGKAKPGMGSLYVLELGNEVKTLFTNVGISSGMAWNPDKKKFYYIDSQRGAIEQYDYDEEDGNLSNGKIVFNIKCHTIPGILNGMTIDTDGNLWVAILDGYRVIKIDPRRIDYILDTIHIPAKQVISLTFGGKNLDELYVTTGSYVVNGVKLPPPHNGAVYKITGTGARGYPAVNANSLQCACKNEIERPETNPLSCCGECCKTI